MRAPPQASATTSTNQLTPLQWTLDTVPVDECGALCFPEASIVECRVVDVYDGDTITVIFSFMGAGFFKEKVRLVGIDTPEMKPTGAGRSEEDKAAEKRAAMAARDWLRGEILNKRVWLVMWGREKYGRWLAEVYPHNGRDDRDSTRFIVNSYSKQLIQLGHAKPYDGKAKSAFVASDFVGPP
jgi:endonuclease YncB( thermonuclease family)